jgi:hypothetical protein
MKTTLINVRLSQNILTCSEDDRADIKLKNDQENAQVNSIDIGRAPTTLRRLQNRVAITADTITERLEYTINRTVPFNIVIFLYKLFQHYYTTIDKNLP